MTDNILLADSIDSVTNVIEETVNAGETLIAENNPAQFLFNIIKIVQENQWIFAIILAVCGLWILTILMRMRLQKKNESSITNMFNKDGSKNEHLGHRTYHIITPIFITITIAFFWYAIRLI